MPKPNYLLLIIILLFVSFFSCKKEEKEEPAIATQSPVKSIRIDDGSYKPNIYEYKYNYDASFIKIISIDKYYNESYLFKINLDYSIAGKLFLNDSLNEHHYNEFEINEMGFVTRELSNYLWFDYIYDTNGYLSKYSFLSLPDGYLLMENEVLNGNILKQTEFSFQNSGKIHRIKEFTFTNTDNVNNLDPDCFYIINTIVPIPFWGKPGKKLVDFIEYWYPDIPLEKKRITFSYKFDAKNRVSEVIRTEDRKETYTYTYYE